VVRGREREVYAERRVTDIVAFPDVLVLTQLERLSHYRLEGETIAIGQLEAPIQNEIIQTLNGVCSTDSPGLMCVHFQCRDSRW